MACALLPKLEECLGRETAPFINDLFVGEGYSEWRGARAGVGAFFPWDVAAAAVLLEPRAAFAPHHWALLRIEVPASANVVGRRARTELLQMAPAEAAQWLGVVAGASDAQADDAQASEAHAAARSLAALLSQPHVVLAPLTVVNETGLMSRAMQRMLLPTGSRRAVMALSTGLRAPRRWLPGGIAAGRAAGAGCRAAGCWRGVCLLVQVLRVLVRGQAARVLPLLRGRQAQGTLAPWAARAERWCRCARRRMRTRVDNVPAPASGRVGRLRGSASRGLAASRAACCHGVQGCGWLQRSIRRTACLGKLHGINNNTDMTTIVRAKVKGTVGAVGALWRG